LAIAVVGAVGGYAYAAGTTVNQQYTGCLLSGAISNVAIGAAPLKSCNKPGVQISWSQTGPQGLPGADGVKGTDGKNGNTILNGIAAPPSSVGIVGDFYLDTQAETLYGPKSGGGWPASGTSLIGPKGDKGDPGTAGSSLAALDGSDCTVDGKTSSLTVSVDSTTGGVTMTCKPVVAATVTVAVNGLGFLVGAGETIVDDTNPSLGKLCVASDTSCSAVVQSGDVIEIDASSTAAFDFTCLDGTTHKSNVVLLGPPSLFSYDCAAYTVTADASAAASAYG
jgi:hypothetical protein